MPQISNEAYYLSVGYSQWGRWQVRKSSVEEPTKYTLIEDLGPSLKAAYIEADGEFKPDYQRNHFVFLSDDNDVWLAVITTDDRLFVKKLGDSIDTAILISEDVSEACLCRSWRSTEYAVDSGLFIGYVTLDGRACYRSYAERSGERSWGPEEVIEDRGAEHIQIIRTNDYRTCIRVYPSGIAYLTQRDYIGGTVRTEFVYTDSDTEFLVFATETVDEPPDDFEVIEVKLVEPTLIRVTANYPFYSRYPGWEDISCDTNPVVSFTIDGGLVWITLTNPITSAAAYLEFKIRAFNRLRYAKTANCRPICPAMSFFLESGPIRVTEYVSSEAEFNSAYINSFPVREFTHPVVEYASVEAALGNSVINSMPVVDLDGSVLENVYANADLNSVGINNEMTGVVPV